MFDEPLVPVGREPGPAENSALAAALLAFSQRTNPDDFSSLSSFLKRFPRSPWRAALLTSLGIEYYHGAHYSLALDAWREAWALGRNAADLPGKFQADRAVCELASLYSRLGRMDELHALLESVSNRAFLGGTAERINLAREALQMMRHQPGISFRCGPLALQSIARSLNSDAPIDPSILNAASAHRGFSLTQVAEIGKDAGLNYQMAFRRKGGAFVVPSVVHWKVGHYAAMIQQVGDRYLLEDSTFGNTVWATRQTLESETSGYFLLPPGKLPPGWRDVSNREGNRIWGKGVTSGIDPDNYTPDDLQAGQCPIEEMGMAISRVHLGLANLQIRDTPVGYAPPVGPAVRFTVRYNHRDYLQPASQISTVLGPKWSHDWTGHIRDTPANPLAEVKYFVGGGGARTFTGFAAATQTFALQQFDQTRLRRTGPNSYEMLYRDGSKKIFALRSANRVYLTQVVDPAGNAVTLTYDGSLRLVSLTDAIGQVTTLEYTQPGASLLITKVTDPFGRSARFDYGSFELLLEHDGNPNTPPVPTDVFALTNITDVLGLSSRFEYAGAPAVDTNMTITRLTTPYGASTFLAGQGGGPSGSTRFLETVYPDGSRDRVEYNQNTNGLAFSEPAGSVPQGINAFNQWMHGRNTYYWDRNACAQAYGDYSKATIYHWLHSPNVATTAGILESVKAPLERRVWYNYPGQGAPYHTTGSSDLPIRVGRVLDDGTTQLDSYAYNSLGRLVSSIDPIGRELTYIYATNQIDLLEIRQTRGTNNELLFQATYNSQHLPVTITDAAGQTTTNTYNARGQLLTSTNPKGETSTFTYDSNGYVVAADGPLPGTNDTFRTTYDALGRVRTRTDDTGYTLTFDYDTMDRITRVTHPDSTYLQFTYNRLDTAGLRDTAGRQTFFEHDSMRQLTKRTDPLGRVTQYQWCNCGGLRGVVDANGRITQWDFDVQGRPIAKQFPDGSEIRYAYENTTSRLREVIDEKQQVTLYTYNRDNTVKSVVHANAAIATPGVSYTYDPDYERITSMTDGIGTTVYSYVPIASQPVSGAGEIASVDGPLPNDTIIFGYDSLGQRVSMSIGGVQTSIAFDEIGRLAAETNALGVFGYAYEGTSDRMVLQTSPHGITTELNYASTVQDRLLQRMTHKAGSTAVSEFIYGRDIPAGRVATWSQRFGALAPDIYSFGYDAANQLLRASVTNGGAPVKEFIYAYDSAGNRVLEQEGGLNQVATYNALNQISTSTAHGASRTNEWDAVDRLVAVNTGSARTEFSYDGLSRLASLRQLTNGVEVSLRRFVWCGDFLCEERDAAGAVVTRFFNQGMKRETGAAAGNYYYTRDHLGSIRELLDAGGNVRARYSYDPFGRRTRIAGDLDAAFGFAGMFWVPQANLFLTRFRAYDPDIGRWLSRDPMELAEAREGPNLYAYVGNNPINFVDPEGLAFTTADAFCLKHPLVCAEIAGVGAAAADRVRRGGEILQRGWQAVQCGADRLLPGRIQAIRERVPEAVRQFKDYLKDPWTSDNVMKLGVDYAAKGKEYWATVYMGPPHLWLEVGMAFDDAALLLSQRMGISLEAARSWLSFITGFTP